MTPSAPTGLTSTPRASDPEVLAAPELDPVDERATGLAMWAVVFAGGIGSRFWPLSTPRRPKPLLSLVTGNPLLADTVGRLQPLVPPERVLVMTSRDIAPAIREAIRDLPPENVLVEPQPLGTAASLGWGAHEVVRRAGRGTAVCALHADLAAGFPGAYRETLRLAAAVAVAEDAVVAVGIRPTRPEASFGYLTLGAALHADVPLAAGGPHHVDRFVEKPPARQAEALVASGALWHAGIVVSTAGALLDALDRHTPEFTAGLPFLGAGDVEGFAGATRSVSIERGLLERLERLLVLLGEFDWDDVGTWASLRRARELDDDGNGALGPVHFVDATSNVVHTEAGDVVLFGVSKLLVVKLDGLTFVTTLERAGDLRPLLDALPGSLRIEPMGSRAK